MRRLSLILTLTALFAIVIPAFAQDSYSVSRPGCPTSNDVREDQTFVCGFVIEVAGKITERGLVEYTNGYGTAVTIGEDGLCIRQDESYFMAPYKPVTRTCIKGVV